MANHLWFINLQPWQTKTLIGNQIVSNQSHGIVTAHALCYLTFHKFLLTLFSVCCGAGYSTDVHSHRPTDYRIWILESEMLCLCLADMLLLIHQDLVSEHFWTVSLILTRTVSEWQFGFGTPAAWFPVPGPWGFHPRNGHALRIDVPYVYKHFLSMHVGQNLHRKTLNISNLNSNRKAVSEM